MEKDIRLCGVSSQNSVHTYVHVLLLRNFCTRSSMLKTCLGGATSWSIETTNEEGETPGRCPIIHATGSFVSDLYYSEREL